jgi:hypothetical protein
MKHSFRDQLDKMSEEQLKRFEFFVRSHFPRKIVKKHIGDALESSPKDIPDDIAVIVSSLTKLFIGEVIYTGR